MSNTSSPGLQPGTIPPNDLLENNLLACAGAGPYGAGVGLVPPVGGSPALKGGLGQAPDAEA
jgi:hypothetical protein